MNPDQLLSNPDLEQIKANRSVRRVVAQNSHQWFMSLYLSHYITHPFADFHKEMFFITENTTQRLAVLVAFRGSGKSTIMTLSYPIWAIVGAQQKKFVLILSQTQVQARQHLSNIKRELETNELLKADIGPFQEYSDEWGSSSIVLSNFGAKIMIASSEQSIRGLRHGQYRPDLVICDDVEDLNSVKNRDSRNKTFNWLSSEVMPIGDDYTKVIIVGNLLHEDCLLMRLKKAMVEGRLEGNFYAYPLLGEDGKFFWPGKYPDTKAVNRLKATISSESAWYREYLLKIISDEDRLIKRDWIRYYDEIPEELKNDSRFTATGIDLAISQKETADCTAMVTGKVYGYKDNLRVYIMPNPVNKRINFPETVNTATHVAQTYHSKLYIEEVGYQKSLIDYLVNQKNISAEGVKTMGQDKHSRLALITHLVEQGKVLFPKQGCEELIEQLTGFGIEKHDDLADAFTILMHKVLEKDNEPEPCITIISTGSIYDHRWRGLSFNERLTMDMEF